MFFLKKKKKSRGKHTGTHSAERNYFRDPRIKFFQSCLLRSRYGVRNVHPSVLTLTLGNLITKVGGRLTAYSHLEVSYPHCRWRQEPKKKNEVEKQTNTDAPKRHWEWKKSCPDSAEAALGLSASAVLRTHCAPELNSELMFDLGDASLASWKTKQSCLNSKRLVFFFPRSQEKTPNSVLRWFADKVFCVGREATSPQSPAARAPFQDLVSCGQRPLIQLPGSPTSTRRPAPRHSRRIQPITGRALPRASTPTSDTILRRITAIGYWESPQPMTRRGDRRVHQCRELVKRLRDQGVNDHIFNFN